MNEMLARLQEASERQQRFVGDASHELRSPLTRMRAELEVDLSHPPTADHTATHRSVLEEVGNLERLVEDLLHLARAEPTGTPGSFEVVVDLAELVEREARRYEGAGPEIDTRGLTPAAVHGDPAQLARMVRNLADNASRHAASRMRFETDQHDDVVALVVSDDGPGVPEADRDRVFERFARLDEARTSGTGGTGLGLAIVRDIVVRHGGTIRVDRSHDGGARFVVLLPGIAEL
jgi:signal transduction histidine kinase